MQTSVDSKFKKIHVIAVVSSKCLVKSHFALFTSGFAKDFIRRFLRHIQGSTPLDQVVVVLDNAPNHNSAKDGFEEDKFSTTEMMKLGSDPPMLNPTENMFSAYKRTVKRSLARQR
ncbi:LOW QUALITY PROTEIN: hypothetical protein PHPALM_28484 [Phytophthora palmivora]|uniref:Tc1-like transposase DDE domain-containing protein n=1 Tax=Phytophthora palmivora TaxID=4796 RepID=A0A2P4X9Z4_9STRA|nr:LOW QUALITY PROTEIN: hypothetical protein PHPALM_28484 [Phytophthora palmivora]